MAQKRPYQVYKSTDRRGRTVKYGITKRPHARQQENRRAGLGDRLVPMSGPRTRKGAKARETELIDKYTRSKGHKPPGNKIR